MFINKYKSYILFFAYSGVIFVTLYFLSRTYWNENSSQKSQLAAIYTSQTLGGIWSNNIWDVGGYPDMNDDVVLYQNPVTLSADQNVHNIILAVGGTLNLAGHTLNVYGDWTNSGGVLNTNGGTVNFASTSTQSIMGINTFENLTKNASTTSYLLFDSTATTTITGNVSLSGTENNLLHIGVSTTTPIFVRKIQGFSFPVGVTIDTLNNIYVADQDLGTVSKFDSQGNYISSLNTTGTGTLRFLYYLASDASNNIYVTDGDKNKVIKFDSAGQYSTSSPVFNLDGGITVDNSGNIYITTYDSPNKILKLDSNFNILASTTIANGINYSFCGGQIALDRTENFLYALDTCNDRIVKLNSSDLSYVNSLTKSGPVTFNSIYGITFDINNNMYLAHGFGRIIKLAADFSYISQWGGVGTDNYKFSSPNQLASDSNGNIFVADSGNNRILEFNPINNSTIANVLHTGSGTVNLSYLSVFGSNNISATSFGCTTGCVNVAGNTNWIFSDASTVIRRRYHPYIPTDLATTSDLSTTSGISTTSTTTSAIVTANNVVSTTTPVISTTTQQFIFTKTLQLGSRGEDVRQLQIFLNTHGFEVAKTGAGSLGKESTYFGTLTKQAVIKFQEKYIQDILDLYGLEKGTGIFGPYSRKMANKILLGQ